MDPFAAFMALLSFDAQGGDRPGHQARQADRLAGFFTIAITPLVDPSPQQLRASHINPLTGEEEIAGPSPAEQLPRTVRHARDVAVDPNNPQTWGKVQRNAPCPCGSGRKFKHCHGALV